VRQRVSEPGLSSRGPRVFKDVVRAGRGESVTLHRGSDPCLSIQRLCDSADVRPFEQTAVSEGLRNAFVKISPACFEHGRPQTERRTCTRSVEARWDRGHLAAPSHRSQSTPRRAPARGGNPDRDLVTRQSSLGGGPALCRDGKGSRRHRDQAECGFRGKSPANPGSSRPPFRFDLARRSEMISPAIPG
jgi:hypothetical protein